MRCDRNVHNEKLDQSVDLSSGTADRYRRNFNNGFMVLILKHQAAAPVR